MVYSASMTPPRQVLARREETATSDTRDLVLESPQTILKATTQGLSQLNMVRDGHVNARLTFSEARADVSDAAAGGLKVYLWGSRGFVGYRWPDLTKQPNEKSGTVVNGPVTIAGKTYPKALTFAYSGIYFNTAGKCTTLRGSVGAPDAEAGELLVISIPTTADEEAQEFRTAAPAGAAPKAASYSVTKRPMIAFGHGDAEGRVSFVSPEVRCSVNALSAVPEELSPR